MSKRNTTGTDSLIYLSYPINNNFTFTISTSTKLKQAPHQWQQSPSSHIQATVSKTNRLQVSFQLYLTI